jgi:hypothetical protein
MRHHIAYPPPRGKPPHKPPWIDARELVKDREAQVLRALGIKWPPPKGKQHIKCPFNSTDHKNGDKHPSWRWDADKAAFFCVCGGGNIFEAVKRMRGCDFPTAARFIRETIIGPDRMTMSEAPAPDKPKNMQDAQVEHVFAEILPRPKEVTHREWGKPSRIDPYHDPETLIAEVRVRYDGEAVKRAGKDKVVLPWIWNGKRWICKQMQGSRFLYRLPMLLYEPDAQVLHVEGEPAVEAATNLFEDYVCTTTSGG